MSKFYIKQLWEERYGRCTEIYDYAGRKMLKSACGNPNSAFAPTIDHIRPLADGGKDIKENIIICNCETNEEKGDRFPHWMVNGWRCHAKRMTGKQNGYIVIKEG